MLSMAGTLPSAAATVRVTQPREFAANGERAVAFGYLDVRRRRTHCFERSSDLSLDAQRWRSYISMKHI
jgi:hypothetical protein